VIKDRLKVLVQGWGGLRDWRVGVDPAKTCVFKQCVCEWSYDCVSKVTSVMQK
jgi:hypothetical protein